jgi:hypothetical protein
MQAFPAYAVGMTGWNVHDFISREPPQVMHGQLMSIILCLSRLARFFWLNRVFAGNEVTC